MSGLATAWADWCASVAWQTAVLAALVALLDRLLARRGVPHLRHALWLLVAAKFALPPSLASPFAVAALAAPGCAAAQGGTSGAEASPADGTWAPLAAAVWLVGAGAAAALAGRRALAFAHVVRRDAVLPVPERLRAALRTALDLEAASRGRRRRAASVPRIVVTSATPGIALAGWLRPVLVVPPGTEGALAPDALSHAFLHELAHLRRGDLVVARFLAVLRIVFWFHPAAWLAERRIAVLREVCCDADAAETLGARAPAYRETLLDAARRAVAGTAAPAVGWLGARHALLARLEELERPRRLSGTSRRAVTSAAVAVLCACAVPMGTVARAPADAAPQESFSADAARALLARAASGDERPGCFRTRWAVVRLVQDERSREGAAADR